MKKIILAALGFIGILVIIYYLREIYRVVVLDYYHEPVRPGCVQCCNVSSKQGEITATIVAVGSVIIITMSKAPNEEEFELLTNDLDKATWPSYLVDTTQKVSVSHEPGTNRVTLKAIPGQLINKDRYVFPYGQ